MIVYPVRAKTSLSSMSLKTNSITTVGFTVLLSATSYGLNSTAARLLTPVETSKVVILWTAINMAILLFQSPIEVFAPRLRGTLEAEQGDTNLNPLVMVYFSITGIMLAIISLVVSLTIVKVSLGVALSLTFFLFGYSIFYWQRVLLYARNDFNTILKKSFVVFLSAVIFFGTLIVLDSSLIWPLFTAAAICYLIPVFFKSSSDLKELFQHRKKFLASVHYLKKSGIFHDSSLLVLSNAVSLLILVGGVFIAPLKELDPSEIVTYSAMISLSMVPMLVLNSLVLPIVLQAAMYVENGDYTTLWSSYVKTIVSFIGAILMVATPYLLFGSRLISFFLGNQYSVDNRTFFLVAIATGLAATTGVPRLLLTSLGGVRIFNKFLITALVFYSVVVFVSSNSPFAFILSTTLSSSFLILSGTILIRKFTIENIQNV